MSLEREGGGSGRTLILSPSCKQGRANMGSSERPANGRAADFWLAAMYYWACLARARGMCMWVPDVRLGILIFVFRKCACLTGSPFFWRNVVGHVAACLEKSQGYFAVREGIVNRQRIVQFHLHLRYWNWQRYLLPDKAASCIRVLTKGEKPRRRVLFPFTTAER